MKKLIKVQKDRVLESISELKELDKHQLLHLGERKINYLASSRIIDESDVVLRLAVADGRIAARLITIAEHVSISDRMVKFTVPSSWKCESEMKGLGLSLVLDVVRSSTNILVTGANESARKIWAKIGLRELPDAYFHVTPVFVEDIFHKYPTRIRSEIARIIVTLVGKTVRYLQSLLIWTTALKVVTPTRVTTEPQKLQELLQEELDYSNDDNLSFGWEHEVCRTKTLEYVHPRWGAFRLRLLEKESTQLLGRKVGAHKRWRVIAIEPSRDLESTEKATFRSMVFREILRQATISRIALIETVMTQTKTRTLAKLLHGVRLGPRLGILFKSPEVSYESMKRVIDNNFGIIGFGDLIRE